MAMSFSFKLLLFKMLSFYNKACVAKLSLCSCWCLDDDSFIFGIKKLSSRFLVVSLMNMVPLRPLSLDEEFRIYAFLVPGSSLELKLLADSILLLLSRRSLSCINSL